MYQMLEIGTWICYALSLYNVMSFVTHRAWYTLLKIDTSSVSFPKLLLLAYAYVFCHLISPKLKQKWIPRELSPIQDLQAHQHHGSNPQ